MSRRFSFQCLFIVLLACYSPVYPWQSLAPGLELGSFVATRPCEIGDRQITILRIDPHSWKLEFAGASQEEDSQHELRSAEVWCAKREFVAAINAGMFQTDYLSNVGYLKAGDHLNNPGVNHYLSVAAFDPLQEGLPPFRIFDLDLPGITQEQIIADYGTVIQNLRLIKRPGENRWKQQQKRWSEVALGEDIEGNVLFIYCRSPYSMHDLNGMLLALDINLLCAQHLEGGPEAQLYINVAEFEQQLVGSFETGFFESDAHTRASSIPNVIGVKKRSGN